MIVLPDIPDISRFFLVTNWLKYLFSSLHFQTMCDFKDEGESFIDSILLGLGFLSHSPSLCLLSGILDIYI